MRSLVILTGLWVSVGQLFTVGLSATISELAFEEMLPGDTVLYFCVPDGVGLVEKFKNTNLYKMAREIELLGLLNREPRFQRIKELYGTFIEPLTQVFQRRMALAITDIPRGRGLPEVVFLADMGGKEEQLRQCFKERIHPALERAGVTAASFKDGEYEVQELSFRKPVPFSACYAVADGVFIATVGRQGIEELLSQPRRAKSLAEAGLFKEVRAKLGERCDFLAYNNISAMMEGLRGGLRSRSKVFFDALGLADVKAAGFGLEFREHAGKQTLFIYTGAERRGLLALLPRGDRGVKAARYVPEDTTLLWAVSLGDFAEFWDGVTNVLRSAMEAAGEGPHWERAMAKLRQWENRSGFRIKDDVLSPFAGEVAVSVKVPEVMGVPPTVLLIEVKDSERAMALIEKLMAALENLSKGGLVKVPEQYKDVAITTVFLLPHGGGVRGASLAGLSLMRPAFAVVGDFLVIGVHSSSVKKVVDAYGSNKSLKDNPNFKRVVANLSEKGSMTLYVNMREVYDFLYGIFGGLAAREVPGDIVARLGRVGQYLGSSASRVSCDEKGITYETFSESCLPEQALAIGALLPMLVSARGKALAAACMSNVMNLSRACIMYENEHGVLPSKLSELYPGYIDKLNVFVCPVHAGKEISERNIDEASDYRLEIPGAKLADVKDPARTVMISEKEANHDGARNAGYADGHVERAR